MAGSLTTPIRKRPYPAETDVPDAGYDIGALALALDLAPNVSQGVLASRPAAAASGNLYLVTGDPTPSNNGIVWWDLGTTWTAINTPATKVSRRVHSWTWDDQTTPNPAATVLGSFPVMPAANETVKLVGAVIHCATVGSTPTVFSVAYDHGAHGTLSTVPGLGSLTPSAGSFVLASATGGPLPLAALDRVCVELSTAGNSLGCTVAVVTEHTT